MFCFVRVYYEPTHDRSNVALIAQLVEHCTGNTKVVGSNPVYNLKIFSGLFPSSVMAAFASIIIKTIMFSGDLVIASFQN